LFVKTKIYTFLQNSSLFDSNNISFVYQFLYETRLFFDLFKIIINFVT